MSKSALQSEYAPSGALDAGSDWSTDSAGAGLHALPASRATTHSLLAATWRGRAVQVGADLVAVLVATYLARQPSFRTVQRSGDQTLLWLVTPAVFVVVFAHLRLYSARTLAFALEELRRIVYGSAIAALVVGYVIALNEPARDPREDALLASISIVTLMVERRITRRYFSRRRARGCGARRTVLVGSGDDFEALRRVIADNPDLGYRIVGIASVERAGSGGDAAREVVSAVRRANATDVLLAAHALDGASTKALARVLHDLSVRVELSSGLIGIDATRLTVATIGGKPVLHLEPSAQRGRRAVAKRMFDVAGSVCALALAAPLVAAAALAIWLSDRGPVLFRQDRAGKDGVPFQVLKLRTMSPDAEAHIAELRAHNEADGPLFKIRNDPRITPVGRLLRRLSIDEIPQFWNVLRGEMSLVGPRPALLSEVEQWEPDVRDRLRVKPGITGMWQVSGRSSCSFEDYVRLDLYYVDNWNLLYDLAILVKTIPAVVRSSGAY